MRPRPSREPRNEGKPHVDKVRNKQDTILYESPETADGDRDLVRDERGTIEIPTKPAYLSKDD